MVVQSNIFSQHFFNGLLELSSPWNTNLLVKECLIYGDEIAYWVGGMILALPGMLLNGCINGM